VSENYEYCPQSLLEEQSQCLRTSNNEINIGSRSDEDDAGRDSKRVSRSRRSSQGYSGEGLDDSTSNNDGGYGGRSSKADSSGSGGEGYGPSSTKPR